MNVPKDPDAAKPPLERAKRVIRLDDLDWEDETVGGANAKLFFGEESDKSTAFGRSFGPPKP